MLSNGGLRLSFKCGIDDGELPSGRGFASPYSILPAVKVQIDGDVTAIVNSRQRRAEIKIHVRQIGMLGISRAHASGAGISVLNFYVDVAHCGIKRSWICVWGTRRCFQFRFADVLKSSGTRTSEKHHVRRSLLKAGGIPRQHKSRASCAETDEANTGPDVNRPAQAITACGNEYDALISVVLHFVNGGL